MLPAATGGVDRLDNGKRVIATPAHPPSVWFLTTCARPPWPSARAEKGVELALTSTTGLACPIASSATLAPKSTLPVTSTIRSTALHRVAHCGSSVMTGIPLEIP